MFKNRADNLADFVKARYGLFIHYGLYSILGRGEWVMNKELIPPEEYGNLAKEFNPKNYDAEKICKLAKDSGMSYICITTMHHDGFMLYDSKLCSFNSVNACGRDLVQETIDAARKYNLRVHLYHSLNNWSKTPDAVEALESKTNYDIFISNTFERIKELVTKYSPIDCLWYDGWWPFNATAWQAEAMNKMVSEIQPWMIFNGRNGLSGDFTTPEGHMGSPNPWRAWEACITLNDNWSYVKGDDNWKSSSDLISMLLTAAKGNGNLLLGVAPLADGSIPTEAQERMLEVGNWLKLNKEAIFNTEVFNFNLEKRGDGRSDWSALCDYTVSGNNLYLTTKYGCDKFLTITGLEQTPQKVTLLENNTECKYQYNADSGKLVIEYNGIVKNPRMVFKVECNSAPSIYRCGGMRTPQVEHPPYDPCPSDLNW